MKKTKILLKLYFKNGLMKMYTSSGEKRRISSIISHVDFEKAYLKVSYGKALCVHDCVCNFFNDGWYCNKHELLQVFKAFMEGGTQSS